MYHYDIGPSLRQKFIQKQKKVLSYDSADRFSSFQSQPPSDHELEEFSDYQSPPKEKVNIKDNKQKSYILVEQLPLQYHSSQKQKKQKESRRQKKQIEKANHSKSISYSQKKENFQHKYNSTIKYNYLQQVSRQLSTIKEDQREYLRESLYAGQIQKNLHHLLPIAAPFPPPTSIHSHYPTFNYLHDQEAKMQSRIVIEQQKLRAEELRLKNALLKQENITLKERIFFLQSELRKKLQISKYAQSKSPKMNKSLEEQLQQTRKQTKRKLLEQISILQSRCQQMKQQMTAYKLRQEERLTNLLKEQETKKQFIKIQKKQQMEKQSANQYYAKFVEVFLTMIKKLPFKLDSSWSKKKKIAVGWKIVKHFIRKGLKLGIVPPTLIQRQDSQ